MRLGGFKKLYYGSAWNGDESVSFALVYTALILDTLLRFQFYVSPLQLKKHPAQ